MAQVLPILKDSYLEELEKQASSSSAIKLYDGPDSFELDDTRLFKETPLEFDGDMPSLTIGDAKTRQERAATDLENAILVHKFLPDLSLTMASDRRLWACLTHGPFFDYCCKRWPFPDKEPGKTNNIREHWFFKRGLRRNAIARLWWAAELTNAPWKRRDDLAVFEKEDEYHYTRVLLSNQDIFQGIVERDFGNSLHVRICALDTIDSSDNGSINLTRLATRFTKDVNLLASHTDLGAMQVEDLQWRMMLLAEAICQNPG